MKSRTKKVKQAVVSDEELLETAKATALDEGLTEAQWNEKRAKLQAIFQRIERRRRILNLTERKLSIMASLSYDYVRSARRNFERGEQFGIGMGTAAKLAKVLKTSPEWLMHGVGQEETGGRSHASGGKTVTIELRCVWEINPENNMCFVEETLGDHGSTKWGPMPSRALADQLVEERKGIVEKTLQKLINETT